MALSVSPRLSVNVAKEQVERSEKRVIGDGLQRNRLGLVRWQAAKSRRMSPDAAASMSRSRISVGDRGFGFFSL